MVIAISQSGETADTLSALKLAKQRGAFVYGICNVVGSSIARSAGVGTYTHAGPEIGVASTKSFTSQVTVLILIALYLNTLKERNSSIKITELTKELVQISDKMSRTIDDINDKIIKIAELYKNAKNFLYLGRGISFPVALEGALKLKEISYIHAEGYPAAELKHGPIALINSECPCIFIVEGTELSAKVLAKTARDIFLDPTIIEDASKELTQRQGNDFVYYPLLGDREPPLDYRLISN